MHVKQPAKIWALKFYKEKVQHKVKAECEANGITPNKVLNVIKHLIKEAFKAEPEEVQQEILAESQALKEATKVKRTTSTIATPESYAEATSYISEVSYRFLNTQHEQTGWTWTLLSGEPDPSHGGRLWTVDLDKAVASPPTTALKSLDKATASSPTTATLPDMSFLQAPMAQNILDDKDIMINPVLHGPLRIISALSSNTSPPAPTTTQPLQPSLPSPPAPKTAQPSQPLSPSSLPATTTTQPQSMSMVLPLASVPVASTQSVQLSNTADVTAASDVPSPLPTSSDEKPTSSPSNSSSLERSMLPEQGWSKLLAGLSKTPAPPPTAIPINQLKPKSVLKAHAKKAATKKAMVPVSDAVMICGQCVRKAPSGKEITPLTVDANGNPTFDREWKSGDKYSITKKHKK
ncbi:hypothetical protein C0995_006370 [Termitomyces sp. Mi166|nr:hypothetical protein C0995_006370 [Termitomyces sp. Mi166\